MSARPAVSVIVPFAGSDAELARWLENLDRLATEAGDEVLVADNSNARAGTGTRTDPRLLAAHGLRSPGFARNRAARRARAPWLVFIDADTTPSASLLDDYFDPLSEIRRRGSSRVQSTISPSHRRWRPATAPLVAT